MAYEVYLDLLFVENLLMNYFLLRIAALLLTSSVPRWRSLAAAGLGAASAVLWLLFFRQMPEAAEAVFGIGVTAGMVKSGCDTRSPGELLAGCICLLLASFLMEGVLRLVLRFTGSRGVTAFAAAGTAGYTIVTLLIMQKGRLGRRKARTVTVRLMQNGKWKKVKGLYDTGNTLRDTTTGKPVSVIRYDLIQELFPDEMREGIAELLAYHEPTHPEALAGLQPHYISFRGMGGAGLLPVIRISEMLLIQGNTTKRIHHPYLALAGQNSSSPRGYEMILHPDLMDR